VKTTYSLDTPALECGKLYSRPYPIRWWFGEVRSAVQHRPEVLRFYRKGPRHVFEKPELVFGVGMDAPQWVGRRCVVVV
jgi:hypothetical protein